MKHKYTQIFIFGIGIILIVVLSSCSDSGDKYVSKQLPDPVELSGDRIFEDTAGLIYLEKANNKWILSKMGDTLLHVYDDSLNKITEFGREGSGPNEFQPPIVFEDVIIHDSTNAELLVLNSGALQIKRVDISESIQQNSAVVSKIDKLPKKFTGTLQIFENTKGEYVGLYDDTSYERVDGKRGYYVYDPETSKIDTYPMTNLQVEPYSLNGVMNINSRWGDISPQTGKLAVTLFYYPLLEVFDLDTGNSNKFYMSPPPNDKTFSLDRYQSEDITDYYSYIDATDSRLYLLYSGYPKNEKEQHRQLIQVISWQGEPIEQFLIPKKYKLAMFVVDEDNNRILGISHQNDRAYQFTF
jgi:hypothetical protein